jgi:hypothetical protein
MPIFCERRVKALPDACPVREAIKTMMERLWKLENFKAERMNRELDYFSINYQLLLFHNGCEDTG